MSKEISYTDKYQRQYTYTLTEPEGKNFDSEFKPDLSPKDMLELGIFGGVYFDEIPSDLPKSWFAKAKLSEDGTPQKDLNYFGVHASQPREEWQRKGWIHPNDPYGWFQWYCRYYLGRRSEDDARQIRRWKAYRRHLMQVIRNCRRGDETCRRKQRQSLLHWAYDARKI